MTQISDLKSISFRDLVLTPTRAFFRNARGLGDKVDVPDTFAEEVLLLRSLCEKKISEKARDWLLVHDDVRYRASVLTGLTGPQVALRRIQDAPSDMTALGVPQSARERLLDLQDGLVVISGKMGSGKTTTAGGFLREYMISRPCACVTLEDPPELLLHGQHDKSDCLQCDVPYERFGTEMVHILRHASPELIFLGELREGQGVREALRASLSGHLVVTTVHAGSIEQTVWRLCSLAVDQLGDWGRRLISEGLAVILHQNLERVSGKDRLLMRSLWASEVEDEKAVRSLIREEKVEQLSNIVEQQKIRMKGTRKEA